MGRDKAFIEFHGQSLLARALQLARSVTPQVSIVGSVEKFGDYGSVTEDVFADRGPLGGIHAALASSDRELNLMLAVDLPFLAADFLNYLVDTARQRRSVVTVPRAGGGLQPLCAVYRREFAEVAAQSLRAGKNKIDPLFEHVSTTVVDEAELTGFNPDIFRNINTPGDLANSATISPE